MVDNTGKRHITLADVALRMRSSGKSHETILTHLRFINGKSDQPLKSEDVVKIAADVCRQVDQGIRQKWVNDWCPGQKIEGGSTSGCSCDCPSCEAASRTMASLADLVARGDQLRHVRPAVIDAIVRWKADRENMPQVLPTKDVTTISDDDLRHVKVAIDSGANPLWDEDDDGVELVTKLVDECLGHRAANAARLFEKMDATEAIERILKLVGKGDVHDIRTQVVTYYSEIAQVMFNYTRHLVMPETKATCGCVIDPATCRECGLPKGHRVHVKKGFLDCHTFVAMACECQQEGRRS